MRGCESMALKEEEPANPRHEENNVKGEKKSSLCYFAFQKSCLLSKYISFTFDSIALSVTAVIWSQDILNHLISVETKEFVEIVTERLVML